MQRYIGEFKLVIVSFGELEILSRETMFRCCISKRSFYP